MDRKFVLKSQNIEEVSWILHSVNLIKFEDYHQLRESPDVESLFYRVKGLYPNFNLYKKISVVNSTPLYKEVLPSRFDRHSPIHIAPIDSITADVISFFGLDDYEDCIVFKHSDYVNMDWVNLTLNPVKDKFKFICDDAISPLQAKEAPQHNYSKMNWADEPIDVFYYKNEDTIFRCSTLETRLLGPKLYSTKDFPATTGIIPLLQLLFRSKGLNVPIDELMMNFKNSYKETDDFILSALAVAVIYKIGLIVFDLNDSTYDILDKYEGESEGAYGCVAIARSELLFGLSDKQVFKDSRVFELTCNSLYNELSSAPEYFVDDTVSLTNPGGESTRSALTGRAEEKPDETGSNQQSPERAPATDDDEPADFDDDDPEGFNNDDDGDLDEVDSNYSELDDEGNNPTVGGVVLAENVNDVGGDCYSPSAVNLSNVAVMNYCIRQFYGNPVKLECMLHQLKHAHLFLDFLNNVVEYDPNCFTLFDLYYKFRHDIFAYIFLTYQCKFSVDLGTDADLSKFGISSVRTPDYIHVSGDDITLYEFSVVNDYHKGLFQKGLGEEGKYKDEIRMLRNKGFTARYFPIILGINNDFQLSISRIEYVIDDKLKNSTLTILEEFFKMLTTKYNHILGLNFTTEIDRDFPIQEAVIDKLLTAPYWCYKYINVNKANWFKAESALDVVTSTGSLRLKYKKNFYVLQDTLDGVDAEKIREAKNVSAGYAVYKFFYNVNSELQGNDPVPIIMPDYEVYDSDKTIDHGEPTTQYLPPYVHRRRRNVKLYSHIDLHRVKEVEAVLTNGELHGDGLHTENNMVTITDAHKKYVERLRVVNTLNERTTPPVIYNPRHSFRMLANSDELMSVNYESGINSSILKSTNNRTLHMLFDEYHKQKVSFKTIDPINYESELTRKTQILRAANKNYAGYIKEKSGMMMKHSAFKFYNPNDTIVDNLKKIVIDANRQLKNTMRYKSRGRLTLTSEIKNMIEVERGWKKNRGFNIFGLADKDLDLEVLKDYMWSVTKPIGFNFEIPSPANDAAVFKKLKAIMNDRLRSYMSEISNTQVFNTLVLLSRVCYSLFAMSAQNFKSDYITFDNCGLDKVILIVQGGQKIASTRKTKIFKLIYPCYTGLGKWNKPERLFEHNGVMFEETPWQQFEQVICIDYITSIAKLITAYCSLRESHTESESKDILTLPLMLLLSNRRKLEALLHNLRYILVNTFAEFTQIKDMLPSFATPNYSAFEACIKQGLCDHYINYAYTAQKWAATNNPTKAGFANSKITHPIIGRSVYDVDDFTFIIYGTYMMSKAPIDSGLEQINNLASVLAIHKDYLKEGQEDIKPEDDRLYDKDFSYSSESAYMAGKLLSAKLKTRGATNLVPMSWNNFMRESVDTMANNRGLRSAGKEFFGNKGYYVIYKKLYESVEFSKVVDLVNSDVDPKIFYRTLKDLNETFASAQQKYPLEKVIFHIVDKTQRGGAREIYVMDYVTKLYQQPLEKLFKVICGCLEEELISVSSAQRAQIIHHKLFEHKTKDHIYFLTMDCRKWAPKSITDKYLYMVLGMNEILPPDFVKSVFFYFDKHKDKQIHVRQRVADRFLSNKINSDYQQMFNKDEEKESSWFLMPYSFVMGIFNLLSSLLHAGSALMSKQLIERKLGQIKVNCTLSVLVHSDDSGGNLRLSDAKYIKYCLLTYDKVQRSLNHMMSLKKCNTSKAYFELLSILYIMGSFVPLLAKFLQNISMSTTGSGISSDFKNIISKSIELQTNGATVQTAYMFQITMSNMYRNYYRVLYDTQIPSIGGFCTTMPHLYLAYGSLADDLRALRYDQPLYGKVIAAFHKIGTYDVSEGSFQLRYNRIVRIPRKYNEIKKGIKLPNLGRGEDFDKWFFKNNKTHNSYLNVYWFRAMMDDFNFAESMLNINELRRLLDTLYMASGKNIATIGEPIDINDFNKMILDAEPTYTNTIDLIKSQMKSLSIYYDYLDSYPEFEIIEKIKHFQKPCKLNLTRFNDMPHKDIPSLQGAIGIAAPELLHLTYTNRSFMDEMTPLKNYLQDCGVQLDPYSIKNFLDFAKKYNDSNITLYTQMPSDMRILYDEPGLHNYFVYNWASHERLGFTSYNFPSKSMKDLQVGDYTDEEKSILTAAVLYKSVYISRLEFLMNAVITIEGKDIDLLNSFRYYQKKATESGFYDMLNLSLSREDKHIKLSSIKCWAVWIEKQRMIAGKWTGLGRILVKLGSTYLELEVKSNNIISIYFENTEETIFDKESTIFFVNFLDKCGLKNFIMNYDNNSSLSLGLDSRNNLLISSNLSLPFILSKSRIQPVNRDFADQECTYTPSSGTYRIMLNQKSYKLETIDNVYIWKHGLSNLSKLISIDKNDPETISLLCGIMIKNNSETMNSVSYDTTDLQNNFIKSDLYKFYYKNSASVRGGFIKDINDSIINEQTTALNIADVLGVDVALSILGKDEQAKLSRLMLYNIEDDELLKFRSKLLRLDPIDQKTKLFELIKGHSLETAQLVTISDVGDYSVFNKLMHNPNQKTVGMDMAINFLDTIADAVFEGIKVIGMNKILISLKDFSIKSIDRIVIDDLIFSDIYTVSSIEEYGYSETISNESLILYSILEQIFDDYEAFDAFSDIFRPTFFRSIPRHPKFLNEWQILIYHMQRHMLSNYIDNEEDVPPRFRRKFDKYNRMTKGLVINNEFEHNGKLVKFKLNKKIDLSTDYLKSIPKFFTHIRIKGASPQDSKIKKINLAKLYEYEMVFADVDNDLATFLSDIDLDIAEKSNMFYLQGKSDTITNTGQYYLTLNTHNTEQAFVENLERRQFCPIITNCINHFILENCTVWKFTKPITGLELSALYLIMPNNVKLDNSTLKPMNLRNLYKNEKNKLYELSKSIAYRLVGVDGIEKNIGLNYNLDGAEINYFNQQSIPTIDYNNLKHISKTNNLIFSLIDPLTITFDNLKSIADILSIEYNEEDHVNCHTGSVSTTLSKYINILKKKNQEVDLSVILNDILNEENVGELLTELDVKRNFYIASNLPYTKRRERLYNIVDDKVSLKQFDDLFNKGAVEFVSGEAVIDKNTKKHLSLTLKRLKKDTNNKNTKAMSSFYLTVLNDLQEGVRNDAGIKFFDIIIEYTNTHTEDDDEDEELPAPVYGFIKANPV